MNTFCVSQIRVTLLHRPPFLIMKRKYDELDEFEFEEVSFGKQILPVAELPADFDDEPADGMQYLFTVR